MSLVKSETWIIFPYDFRDTTKINLWKIKRSYQPYSPCSEKHYFYKLFILWVVKEHCTVEMEHFQWVLQHRIVPFQLSFARWFSEPLCHPISFIIKTLYCKVHFRRNHFFLLWNFSKALTKKLSYGFSIHVLLYFFSCFL